MQQLLRSGVVDAVGFWNSLARMEFLNGQTNTAFMIAESGQYLANGFMWIPKGAPHPVLAQIFVNWRLSDDVQFPAESWGLEPGPWAELQEGFLGESYTESGARVVRGGLLHLLPDDRTTRNIVQVNRLGLLRRTSSRSGWTTTPRALASSSMLTRLWPTAGARVIRDVPRGATAAQNW